MAFLRLCVVLAGAVLLSACSYQAVVAPVSGASLSQVGDRQSGRYAAIVQSGGWTLKAEGRSFSCSVHTVEVDVNSAWEQTMRDALTASLEKVDFLPSVIDAATMKRDGYDGLLVFSPGNAAATVGVTPRFFFGADAIGEATLEAIFVVNWPDGATKQQLIGGRGVGSREVFTCDGMQDAVGKAASVALQELVKQATVTVKLVLAQHR